MTKRKGTFGLKRKEDFSHNMTVFLNVKKEDVEKLVKKGFQLDEIKTIYEELRLKNKGVVLILYTSGKLLLQGKREEVTEIAKQLEKMGIRQKAHSSSFRNEKGVIIGSDESLKGDTFGGIAVAAVKADEATREKLIELGVADSKTLSDKEILALVDKIKRLTACEVRSILPEEYNSRSGTITLLLNKLHKEVAQDLFPGKHIVDKYPGCAAGDVMEEKADSKYVEVAAASILARAAALDQINYLSTLAGFTLPLGSTHVKLALMELKERGLDFRKFVKVDFQNVQEFL